MKPFIPGLIRFIGSFNGLWAALPPEALAIFQEWLRAGGMSKAVSYWIEWVEEPKGDELKPDVSPIGVAYSGALASPPYLLPEILAPWRGGVGSWKVRVTVDGVDMCDPELELFALQQSVVLVVPDPRKEGGQVYQRMCMLYELVKGRDISTDFLTSADCEDDAVYIAGRSGFVTRHALLSALDYLTERDCYVHFIPLDAGEEGSGTFVWNAEFREHMGLIDEIRREELQVIQPIALAEFVRRLDPEQRAMFEALERIEPQMEDAGPRTSIPRRFLDRSDRVLEHFVALLAAAGVVIAVRDHEHGILGKMWQIVPGKHAEAIAALRGFDQARAATPPTPPSDDAQLSRSLRIEQGLARLRDERSRLADSKRALDVTIGEKDALIEDLRYRAAQAERERAPLVKQRDDELRTAGWVDQQIRELELQAVALRTMVEDRADALLDALEAQASELGVPAADLKEAFARRLATRRAS